MKFEIRIGSCINKIKNNKAKKELLTSEGIVRHTKEREAIGSEYVKDVSILREAKSWIGFGWKLLQ